MALRLILIGFFSLLAGMAAAQEGRFITVTQGIGRGLWVVDTETGDAKFCWIVYVPTEETFDISCVEDEQPDLPEQ